MLLLLLLVDKQAHGQHVWCCGTGHAGDRSAARRGAANQRREAAAALPSVPVEAGLNLFMARIGFDLLRSAAVKEHLQAHIQRKLNVLRIPEYISSLEVRPLTSRMLKVHSLNSHVRCPFWSTTDVARP